MVGEGHMRLDPLGPSSDIVNAPKASRRKSTFPVKTMGFGVNKPVFN